MSQILNNQNHTTHTEDAQSSGASIPGLIVPLPMSFPALLLNPKNKTSYLLPSRDTHSSKPTRVTTTLDGKTRGKRHIRRYDNGMQSTNQIAFSTHIGPSQLLREPSHCPACEGRL